MLILSRTSTTFFLSTFLLATAPSPLAAQDVPSTFPELRASMWHGKTVAVTDRSGAPVKGRVLSITDSAITLAVNGQPRTVDASDVARITRRRRHTGRGALIGLSVGALAGIVTGLQGSECSGCSGDSGWALLFGMLFGGWGAGIGTGVGALVHTEEILYASPGASPSRQARAPAFTGPALPLTKPTFGAALNVRF